MAQYPYSPYQDNKTYSGSGGYPSYPPPQNNNTVKIILIIAGAVIAIAIMVVVAVVILNNNNVTQVTPAATAATATDFTDATRAADTIQKMPDLSGLSKEDAISRLSVLGVTVKEIKETETDKAKPGFVFDQVPVRNADIKAGDEVTLYVAKQKVTQPTTQKVTAATTPATVYMYCTANDFVSLRTGKGTSYTELAKIPRGGSMIYIRPDGNWYYVRYGSLEGYVHGDYVSFNSGDVPAGVTPAPKAYSLVCTANDYVSLRTGPHKSYTELVKIPRGGYMDFLSDNGDGWYYVNYYGKKGYVYSEYVAFR